MFDHASRRRRLAEKLDAEGIAALFLGPSADLEYLTGVERPVPSFGQPLYAHGWVTGAFFLPSTAAPCGFTPAGLPVGVQIVGPQYGDLTCLAFAKLLEREFQAFVPPPGYA